jgi:hypothetical protein
MPRILSFVGSNLDLADADARARGAGDSADGVCPEVQLMMTFLNNSSVEPLPKRLRTTILVAASGLTIFAQHYKIRTFCGLGHTNR